MCVCVYKAYALNKFMLQMLPASEQMLRNSKLKISKFEFIKNSNDTYIMMMDNQMKRIKNCF